MRTGFGDLNNTRRTAASSGFFRPHALARAFYGGPGGAAFGLAGFRVYRFANPAVRPATLSIDQH